MTVPAENLGGNTASINARKSSTILPRVAHQCNQTQLLFLEQVCLRLAPLTHTPRYPRVREASCYSQTLSMVLLRASTFLSKCFLWRLYSRCTSPSSPLFTDATGVSCSSRRDASHMSRYGTCAIRVHIRKKLSGHGDFRGHKKRQPTSSAPTHDKRSRLS